MDGFRRFLRIVPVGFIRRELSELSAEDFRIWVINKDPPAQPRATAPNNHRGKSGLGADSGEVVKEDDSGADAASVVKEDGSGRDSFWLAKGVGFGVDFFQILRVGGFAVTFSKVVRGGKG